ncbi:hypothetical protein V1289_003215 [Bradyrhizobium sp. AZCC 2289]
MGNWRDMSAESIARQTKPGRESFFAAMPNAAQSRLSAMQAPRLNLPRKMFSDLGALVHHLTQRALPERSQQTDESKDVHPTKAKRPMLDVEHNPR